MCAAYTCSGRLLCCCAHYWPSELRTGACELNNCATQHPACRQSHAFSQDSAYGHTCSTAAGLACRALSSTAAPEQHARDLVCERCNMTSPFLEPRWPGCSLAASCGWLADWLADWLAGLLLGCFLLLPDGRLAGSSRALLLTAGSGYSLLCGGSAAGGTSSIYESENTAREHETSQDRAGAWAVSNRTPPQCARRLK